MVASILAPGYFVNWSSLRIVQAYSRSLSSRMLAMTAANVFVWSSSDDSDAVSLSGTSDTSGGSVYGDSMMGMINKV